MSMWIGKEIEITHINYQVKTIGILVHVYCAPCEMARPETQARAVGLVKLGVRYLSREGFLPKNPEGWMTHIGGVAHGQPL